MFEFLCGVIGVVILVLMIYHKITGNTQSNSRQNYDHTDEEFLTYSLLSGNKEAEKFMLWKIWSKRK